MLATSLVFLLSLAATPPVGDAPPGVELVIALSEDSLPVLQVRAPGAILRFAVDTGASRTVVSARVAESLGVTPSRRIRLASATGQIQRALGGAPPRLVLAGVALDLEAVVWVPEERELAGTPDVDGLLGADALAGIDLWIDLTRSRARVAPSGTLSPWIDGKRMPLVLLARRPTIAGSFGRRARSSSSLRWVLDSGASSPVLFGAPARRVAGCPARPVRWGRVETPMGSRTVRIVKLGALRTGPELLDTGWTVLLPDVTDRQEDGLLPLGALGPLLLSVSERLLVIDARWRRNRRLTEAELLVAGQLPPR